MLLARSLFVSVCAVLMLGACTSKQAEQDTALQPGKTAASLRLDTVVALVEGDSIADAKSLEEKLNDPEVQLSAVDIDEDGQTDLIEVVEDRKKGKTILELRAIPSSKKDEDVEKVAVLVATVELHIDDEKTIIVDATYSEHIEHDATIHVYHHELPATYEHGVLVVEPGCFFHYVFVLDHEVYLGHHHVVIIETPHDHHKHKKHQKHKKHKKHGHEHGGVVITW